MKVSLDPIRLVLLVGLLLSYVVLCLASWLRQRRQRHALRLAAAGFEHSAPDWIVAYASQTGNAEELAGYTAQRLRLAGMQVQLMRLSELQDADLQRAERILFLVSTYGEGDAPDDGAAFAGHKMTARLPLAQLHYAVLALGDRSYAQFCGFGRALDDWLFAQGAARLFPRIDVDRSAVRALEHWQQQLSHLAGTSDAPDWAAPAFADWRLLERRQLNPGSTGAALWHLELARSDGLLPHWQSGDLAQIVAPSEPERPREYSIASLPSDGRVHLLVRLHVHPDGSAGLASGWLTQQAPLGALIRLRVRAHPRFRLEHNAQRPLILIGNGSGIAGLRAHLKTRALSGQKRNWLIFGERHTRHDYHYRAEIEAWQVAGVLPRLDLVFSRDQPQRKYVQERLLEHAADVLLWLEQDAAIYVCGSLSGMAGGVDATLERIMGRPALAALAAAGRYRRDVY